MKFIVGQLCLILVFGKCTGGRPLYTKRLWTVVNVDVHRKQSTAVKAIARSRRVHSTTVMCLVCRPHWGLKTNKKKNPLLWIMLCTTRWIIQLLRMYFLSVTSIRASGGNNVKNVYEIRIDGILFIRQTTYTLQL